MFHLNNMSFPKILSYGLLSKTSIINSLIVLSNSALNSFRKYVAISELRKNIFLPVTHNWNMLLMIGILFLMIAVVINVWGKALCSEALFFFIKIATE